jgi:hypothetical protein
MKVTALIATGATVLAAALSMGAPEMAQRP